MNLFEIIISFHAKPSRRSENLPTDVQFVVIASSPLLPVNNTHTRSGAQVVSVCDDDSERQSTCEGGGASFLRVS